ncbi:hypothetical protein [Streptomyces sp. NPDC003832]
MTAGRKLLPLQAPGLPLQKFAWLVRAMRAFHGDPVMRDTARFTEVLNRHLAEPVKPATVNRLESGQADFNVERCQAYELALGAQPLDLVDCYLYASRLENRTPKTVLARLREPTATDMELLWQLAAGESLRPGQWLRLAYLYRNRPDLFAAPRLRDSFLHRLLDDAGNCFEKEERLAREVLITVGADIMPLLSERVKAQPLRYFNMCEAVGFIPAATGRDFLSRLLQETQDGAVTANILESMRRNLQSSGIPINDPEARLGHFRDYAISALNSTDEFFTAREEALTLLQWGQVTLTPRERSALSHIREDLYQLQVRTGTQHRRDIEEHVSRRFTGLLADSPLSPAGAPSHVPGIRYFVQDALFAPDRVTRLTAAILVRPWQHSGLLGTAVGTALTGAIDAGHYGIQRAATRFLTKLMHPHCLEPIRHIGWSRVKDDSVRLTVAWALGTGTTHQDIPLLTHLATTATTTATRRVIALAAARLNARPVLEHLTHSHDTTTSTEAKQLFSTLTPPDHRP